MIGFQSRNGVPRRCANTPGPAPERRLPMQDQPTAPLTPTRDGVLFLSGYATSLRVERRHLVVRTGAGRHIREGRFSKVTRPRLRRVVVHGIGGGAITWQALA